MPNKIYAAPNVVTPNHPVIFDAEICIRCNICVDVCQMDVFIPNPQEGELPMILFPDECWYCGTCVEDCPEEGAIRLSHPLMNRVRWKRKDTAEHFRV